MVNKSHKPIICPFLINDTENTALQNEILKNGYKIGNAVVALWNEELERTCEIVERRIMRTMNNRLRYYVHWHELNRRMDEWIYAEEVIREANEQEKEVIRKWKEDEKKVAKPVVKKDAAVAEEGQSGLLPKRTRKRKSASSKADIPMEPEEHDEHEGMDEASIREHEEVTKIKNVRFVQLGKFIMATWYYSPFPKELFPDGPLDYLYFCEYCMAFFKETEELKYHLRRQACPRHPPGNEIYRHENISVFEVDGTISKLYSQNLCYFAKLFLDHKTLYYDVDPFLFYIICEVDDRGFHPAGFFSKEKYSELGYNLACILTFPCHQRKGIGNFIIQFSYELSKKEEKVGSPEKPLSDLGLLSYRSYWSHELLQVLQHIPAIDVSIMDLTRETSIKSEDIISTLQYLDIIKYFNGQYVIVLVPEKIQHQLQKLIKKGPKVDPDKLHWAPLQLDIKRDKWAIKSKIPTVDE